MHACMQADDMTKKVEQRKAYMHWVVRNPCAASWLKYEFKVMSLLDVTGSVFTSHVHVTGDQSVVRTLHLCVHILTLQPGYIVGTFLNSLSSIRGQYALCPASTW